MILVNVWRCDMCHKKEETEQEFTVYSGPPIVAKLPDGWAKDISGSHDYCEDCWEIIFDMWNNGISEGDKNEITRQE